MEKISIARRRLEKKKAAVSVKKPDDPWQGMDSPLKNMGNSPEGTSPPPEETCPQTDGISFPPQDLSAPPQGMSFPPQDLSMPPQGMHNEPQGISNPPQGMHNNEPQGISNPPQGQNNEPSNIPQINIPGLQSSPVLSLDSLISFINEEGGLLELGKKQFTLEIVSGVEKPIKMLVSIQPVDGKKGSPDIEKQGYVTPEEAAETLKVSKHTIYKQLKEGSLKGLKVGCRWRVLLNPAGETEGSERGND